MNDRWWDLTVTGSDMDYFGSQAQILIACGAEGPLSHSPDFLSSNLHGPR